MMNSKSVLATFVVAVLAASVFSIVGISSPLRAANAQAITIEISADENDSGTFFNEGLVRVIVTDSNADDDDNIEDINVDIDATPDTGAGGTGTFTIDETSASSSKFEFYLAHVQADDVLVANIDEVNSDGVAEFPVPGTEAPVIRWGPAGSGADLTVDADLNEDTSFDITVGNTEVSVDYEEAESVLDIDKDSYGSQNLMHLFIFEQDANLDPTNADSFTITAADLDDSVGSLFDISGGNFPDDVTFTETADNTANFEAILQLNSTANAGVDDELVITTESVTLTLNDKADYNPVINANNTSTDQSEVSFSVEDEDGEVDEIATLTFATELKAIVRDNDQNVDSESDDTINDGLNITSDGPGGDFVVVDLEETDDNTGVFEIDASNNEVRITFVNSTAQVVLGNDILELAPEDIDEDILLIYNDPLGDNGTPDSFEFTNEIDLVTPTIDVPEAAGVNDDFTVTLNAPNLNDNPRTRDSYTFNLNSSPAANTSEDDDGIEFFLFRGGQSIGELARIEFEIEGDNPDFAATDLVYTLEETAINTGIFEADIDMAELLAQAGSPEVDDGDRIDVIFHDLFDEGTTKEVSDDLAIGKADTGVDFSRTVLPIPPEAGSDVAVTLGSGVVTTDIIVTDSDENEQSNTEDSILFQFIDDAGPGEPGFEVEIEGDGVDDETVSSLADFTGSLLEDILDPDIADAITDGTFALGETGKTTGTFDETLDFVNDGTLSTDEWQDLEVTFNYIDGDGDEESAGITFRGNDGVLTIDQNSAKAGTVITATAQDEDLNLDDAEEEEFESSDAPDSPFIVSVETDDDEIDGGVSSETFRETGPNTGIYTAQWLVGTDIQVTEEAGDEVNQATLIIFTFNDEVDSSGGSGDEIEIEIPVVTGDGAIQVSPNLVGPGTEISVLITDIDLDQDSKSTENYGPAPGDEDTDNFFVSFTSDRNEVGEASPDLDETGPNTGVFEFQIELITDENDCQDDDLSDTRYDANGGSQPQIGACPGDLIAITYDDEQNSNGRSDTVSTVVEVRSWDPEFTADKDGYAIGDTANILIADPDANRDPDVADSLSEIRVTTTSDAVGEEFSALETGKSTGVFKLSFRMASGADTGALNVKQGDTVTVEYTDEFPADFEEEEEDKDFKFTIQVAGRTGTDATTPTAPVAKDLTGNTVTSPRIGQQIVLSTTIENNNDEPRPFVAIVEVRDSDDFTVYLQWQTGTLNPSGQTEVGLSWTPDAPGQYTVRTFVISSLTTPAPLSEIEESTISVSG